MKYADSIFCPEKDPQCKLIEGLFFDGLYAMSGLPNSERQTAGPVTSSGLAAV